MEWKVRPPSSRDAAVPVEAVATANPPRARQCFSVRLRMKVFPAPLDAYKKEGVRGAASLSLHRRHAIAVCISLLRVGPQLRLTGSCLCVQPVACCSRPLPCVKSTWGPSFGICTVILRNRPPPCVTHLGPFLWDFVGHLSSFVIACLLRVEWVYRQGD